MRSAEEENAGANRSPMQVPHSQCGDEKAFTCEPSSVDLEGTSQTYEPIEKKAAQTVPVAQTDRTSSAESARNTPVNKSTVSRRPSIRTHSTKNPIEKPSQRITGTHTSRGRDIVNKTEETNRREVTVVTAMSSPVWKCLVPVFVAVAAIYISLPHSSTLPASSTETDDLRGHLESLFPSQVTRFYSTVVAAVKGVQVESPQPTALLLVSNGSSKVQAVVDSMAECLAHLLERNLTRMLRATVVHGAHQQGVSPSDSKLAIDKQLEAHFSAGSRVAAVTGIEMLSLEAAKIFYKHCDIEYSQPNDVILVLTVAVHGEIAGQSVEQSVEQRLLDSWSRNPDEVSPILTRVANNLIVLQPDLQFACKLG